jgi:uncharacterized membrane protein
MGDMHKGVWQMSLAMLISGSIGAFVLLSGLPVTEVVFWRCLIGAITLFLFIRINRKPFSPLTKVTLALAILGGVALVINWLLLFAAYERLSIGLSTVVYNTQPFMLVMMGMMLGERVSLVKWGWLLLAFGGVVILLSSELTGAHSANWLAGIALALGAAFFYALTAICARVQHLAAGFSHCHEAVGADVVCDFEAFTGYGINVVAVQLIARCETDGVHEAVKFRPCFRQLGEHAIDAFILSNVTFQNDAGTQLRGKLFHTAFQLLVLVGERQLSAFTVHSLCDAVCDGQFAGNASYQNALTGKKTHSS